MHRATAGLLLCAACRASQPAQLPEAGPSCVDIWLAERHLNEFGDPVGTMYPGGTPLFDEKTGNTRNRFAVLLARHAELAQACPKEMAAAFAP
jgi:hypothetical protein